MVSALSWTRRDPETRGDLHRSGYGFKFHHVQVNCLGEVRVTVRLVKSYCRLTYGDAIHRGVEDGIPPSDVLLADPVWRLREERSLCSDESSQDALELLEWNLLTIVTGSPFR
jgi:hypothetical protein